LTAFVSLADLKPFTAPDGSQVQEVAGRTSGLGSHSLAVIAHPPGTESTAHRHSIADEIYLVWSGRGRVEVEGETREVGPGDAVIIRPGQHHRLWSDGPGDLVLVVSCAPAYDPEEVVWA
jgi:mannose-6-phosphate isomerase-like protein (cupin superfamily)